MAILPEPEDVLRSGLAAELPREQVMIGHFAAVFWFVFHFKVRLTVLFAENIISYDNNYTTNTD